MLRALLGLLLFLVMLSAPIRQIQADDKPKETPNESLFPLKKGTRWVCFRTEPESNRSTTSHQIEVSEEVVFGGKKFYELWTRYERFFLSVEGGYVIKYNSKKKKRDPNLIIFSEHRKK